jgi:hypothetical protein
MVKTLKVALLFLMLPIIVHLAGPPSTSETEKPYQEKIASFFDGVIRGRIDDSYYAITTIALSKVNLRN